jgi:uncharacterized protein with PQ loop repeat
MRYSIHHLHKRKRIHQKLEKYPHENKWMRLLDKIILAVAFIGPLMNIPQIFKVYYLKNADGISLISWSAYTFFDIPWIIYGIAHKEKPIIVAYTLWFLTNALVVIGALMYSRVLY